MLTSESKAIQDSMDITVKDILDVIKKEKSEREREIEHVKKRVDDEKEELKLTINRDRDNLTKKMNEEHDQRRIEQLEMTQRLGKLSFEKGNYLCLFICCSIPLETFKFFKHFLKDN